MLLALHQKKLFLLIVKLLVVKFLFFNFLPPPLTWLGNMCYLNNSRNGTECDGTMLLQRHAQLVIYCQQVIVQAL